MSGPLEYHRGDERPDWVATVSINGAADDLSTGFTFTVLLKLEGELVLTKTTGITGAVGGVATVAWAVGDLDVAPGEYDALLTAKRTADNREWTIEERILIKPR